MKVPTFELAPGHSVPRVINGGWQLSAGHRIAPAGPDETLDGLLALCRAGLDTFDVGDIYVGVEDRLGALRARCRAEGLAVPRVHTKYVPDLEDLPELTRDSVRATIDRSCRRLGVECLDLVQFHWWDFEVPNFVDVAGWLDDLRRDGRIAALGVTNFDARHLGILLEAGIPIVSNQVQYSLLDARPARALAPLCAAHGVALLTYGVLAGGFLSDRWCGASEPADVDTRSQTKYRLIIEEAGGWAVFRSFLDRLAVVARQQGTSVAALAMRAMLEAPGVAAIIIGARDARYISDIEAALDHPLAASTRAALRALRAELRGPVGDVYALERDREGAHGRIMRYDLHRQQGRD